MSNLSRERPLNMTEYICKQDAVDAIHEFPMFMECNEIYIYQKRIEKIPAADVVPVVRCRGCLHFDPDSRFCFLIKGYMQYGDFCSYGKPR